MEREEKWIDKLCDKIFKVKCTVTPREGLCDPMEQEEQS